MNRTIVIAVGFFLTFFAYFSFTAYHLPNAAGPDFKYSRLAADFYFEENRMAVVPDDLDKIAFSQYGNARLLRPPLGFFLSAQMAKLPVLNNVHRAYAYRVNIAMLAALTVMLIFLSLKTYFGNSLFASFGALCIGLMPQFGFYASYFSDDMIAFFASSLLAYTMVLIVKNGITLPKQIFFAFAAGLCVVSKATAWVFLVPAIIFYLIFMVTYSKEYFTSKNFFLPLIYMSLAFIVGGGWWLLFNMYHYGASDIILSKTVAKLAENTAKLDLESLGFKMQGLGVNQLLFLNSKNFIGATYIAFIGNLDWLRLKVGSMQYAFYLWIIVGFVLNAFILLYQSIEYWLSRLSFQDTGFSIRLFVFELILYFSLILQLYIYTRHNVYSDIQIQGKYLMPIILPMTILGVAFYFRAYRYLRDRFSEITIPTQFIAVGLFGLFLLPVVIHVDALVDHVIPFYWPNFEIPAYLSWM